MKPGPPSFLSAGTRSAVGAGVWLGVSAVTVADLRGFSWSSSLLVFAALVLVPLILDLVHDATDGPWLDGLARLQFPAALLLVPASLLPPGWLAVMLAAPWIVFGLALALTGVRRIARRGVASAALFCRDTGLAYLAVGALWTLADRWGLHPLGFGTDIVQLTAVHFHYAGLVLPVLAGAVLARFPASRGTWLTGGGVVAGVPLVAVGITATQLGGPRLLELVAAVVLAASAAGVAVLQMRWAAQPGRPMLGRILWLVSGGSLLFGMALAVLYAARDIAAPLPWLDVPWMRALHGTANALGFAFCGVLGWWLARSRRAA